MRHALRMATVYLNPADYPGRVVVRESEIQDPGVVVTASDPGFVGSSIAAARAWCRERFAVSLPRAADDDPKILEVWL